MKKKSIILLANGKGTRFQSDFKEIPKPLIKYQNLTLIEWSLRALESILPNAYDDLIVVSKYDSVRNFINKEFNIKVFDPGPTNSPAETILNSITLWNDTEILYTLDCDVFFEGKCINSLSPFTLYTVNSNSENFSYVKLDNDGIVNDIIEKKVISNNAIVGFYSFETDKLKCFFKTSNFKELASKREVFLSDIVRDQIKRGIKYSISSVVNYKSLGTPLDLKQ